MSVYCLYVCVLSVSVCMSVCKLSLSLSLSVCYFCVSQTPMHLLHFFGHAFRTKIFQSHCLLLQYIWSKTVKSRIGPYLAMAVINAFREFVRADNSRQTNGPERFKRRQSFEFVQFHTVPNNTWFLRVCSISLENTEEKEKLLVRSNFSFSGSVFDPFGELAANFIILEIVFCKFFQFARV